MLDPRYSQIFIQAAKEIGVHLGDREMLLFTKYFDILRLWNSKMNLVSVRDDAEILLKHFLDALTPVPFLPQREIRILDIGTGPGLPGIPMKIAVDAWRLSLVESSRKRSSFLKEAVRKLALSQVSVIHDRIEHLIGQPLYHQAFDAVISRATLKLPQLIETASDFLVPGGRLVAMKGVIPDQEEAEAMQVYEKIGFFSLETVEVVLPFSKMPRKILIYKKHN
jgi:16S rRNA (guanine527-N7)-methyltransferase